MLRLNQVIDLSHSVIFRESERNSQIVKIEYNSSGDIFLRFINNNVILGIRLARGYYALYRS